MTIFPKPVHGSLIKVYLAVHVTSENQSQVLRETYFAMVVNLCRALNPDEDFTAELRPIVSNRQHVLNV